MKILSKLFNFVIITSKKFNIDESHGISHSMDVLNFANQLYTKELISNPFLSKYKKVIFTSAILHDMCDKKYMCEKEGIQRISNYFSKDFTDNELENIKKIISTMSYSTVKKKGFPGDLGNLYLPYHIVREADLLSAYNFDRCMIYKLYLLNDDIVKNNINFDDNNDNLLEAFNDARKLFNSRVFTHNIDNLFVTETGKLMSLELEKYSNQRIKDWIKIMNI